MKLNKLVSAIAVISAGLAVTDQAIAQNQSTTSESQGILLAQAQVGNSSIAGRVVNEISGVVLEGASVRIVELNREVIAGREGAFNFVRVPAGTYTLQVNYVGLGTRTMSVEVAANETSRVTISMRPSGNFVDEIMVTGRIAGHGEALNIQRNAATYRTVVSADALAQIREGNIGDALVRLPAVSVETRAGVQRTATIRGLAPQYNTVTVDGLRMTNVDGNRDIALDSFPINMLGRVEVVKANTPDLPADAIGGTLNLITRSAFDKDGPILEAEVGTTYNDVRGNWNRQAQMAIGNRFGERQQFGVFASMSYFHDQRGYDTVQSDFAVNAQDRYDLTRALYYDRYEIKDRIGAGLAFDYRPTETDKYYFKSLYNYDYRDLNHYGTDWRPNNAQIVSEQNGNIATTNGRVDAFAFYREPKNVFQMHILGGENMIRDWTVDYRVAWSKAKKDYPETIQIIKSFNGVDLTYNRRVPDFPEFQITNNVNVNDPNGLAFRQLQVTQVPRVEDEWSWDANLSRDFIANNGTMWTFKTGARITTKDASQAQPDTIRFTGLAGIPTVSLLEHREVPSGFMSASGGRAQLLGFYPDWRQYDSLVTRGDPSLTQNQAARLFSDSTRANADFDISEDIYGLYSQVTVDFEKLQILGGVRWERTETESRANRVVTDGTQVTGVEPVIGSGSYNKLLPGLHFRYTATEQLLFRAAITKALSRPPPGDLIASVQENAQLNQRIIGNPNLLPAESVNLDFSAEYYYSAAGVLSAAVFHKDIKNFVFNETRIASDGVDERTRVNGDGGDVLGLELVWNQQFTSLPAPFDGLGIEANYTRLDSKGRYPGRLNDDLSFINSPDYIFNGILSYARGPLDIRILYNKLPDRLESVGGRAALDRYNAGVAVWDMAVRYDFMDNYRFFLNIKNLTDEPTVTYIGNRDNPTLVTYFGTQYNFGFQYNF